MSCNPSNKNPIMLIQKQRDNDISSFPKFATSKTKVYTYSKNKSITSSG